MKISKTQKKFIKKHLRNSTVEEISNEINIPVRDLEKYVIETWGKEKLIKTLPIKETSLPISQNTNKYHITFLILLIFICYINSLNNDFVSDDITNIVNAPTLNSIKYALGGFGINIRNALLFLINRRIGLEPMYYRIPNILFHIGSTILLYKIVSKKLSGKVGLIASAIFATHPIMSEAITWISGGVYAFSSFFTLLAFYFYINREINKKYYPLSIISFVLSFLTLVQSAALAPIFLIYEYSENTLKKNLKRAGTYFLILLLSIPWYLILARERAQGLQINSSQGNTFTKPLIQIPIAIGEYLKLIFWPKDLTLYHTELSFTQTSYLVHLFVLTCFLLLIIYLYKKQKKLVFWPLLFLIALSPTLTPLGISWIVAERYAYLASAGIFVLIAWAVERIIRKVFKENYTKAIYLFLAIILIPLSIRTMIRNKDWQSHDTLWIATAKFSPSSAQNHNNLGDYYGRHREYEKALEEFKKAIELKPDYADAYHNLANTYGEMGDVENAITNYENAIKFNPNLWQSYQNLGAIYFNLGDKEKTKEFIEKALKINPENEDLRKILETISNQ